MKTAIRFAGCVLVLLGIGGCAAKNPGLNRYQQYCAMLNPLVAKSTKEQVLRRFGMPSKREQVGKAEVWQYLKNYGAQAVAAKSSESSAQVIALGIYDDVTIIFDEDGKLQSWKADIR